jgi:uncharacterized FlgJ-related protein
MFYKYDKQRLQYVKINWIGYGLKILGSVVVLILIMGVSMKPNIKANYTETEVKVIMSKYNKFTEEKLIEEIKGLHFKFPYIVLAQAMHETNYFKSNIFNENHNLFGMKEANRRINLAKGTQNEHAYYNTWNESLNDYALYASTYLSDLKTEEDYFDYLSQNYAEDKKYVSKLKTIIKDKNLLSNFN